MKKIWEWLNGNKAIFGAVVIALIGQGIFGVEGETLFIIMTWIGNILMGGGILHKLAKGTNNT